MDHQPLAILPIGQRPMPGERQQAQRLEGGERQAIGLEDVLDPASSSCWTRITEVMAVM